MKHPTTTFRLEPRYRERLAVLAQDRGISMTEVLREMIDVMWRVRDPMAAEEER